MFIAHFLFLGSLFFILGIISKYYFGFWLFFILLIFLSFLFLRRIFLVIVVILSFLLGGFYLSYFLKKNHSINDNKIEILKEFPATNNYHKYLAKFQGKNYYLYLPYYYERLSPKDKIIAQIEIFDQKRIFVTQLKNVEYSQYKIIYQTRETINNLINKNYSLKTSEIIGGILYGREINDQDLRKSLVASGLSHLTAMSGYNLVVLTSLAQRFFSLLSLSSLGISMLSIFFILIFIVFTGFQSSVIRAGIMMIILILAKILGKPPVQRNIIMLTITLISLFNPLALIEDLGFQLSILATLGLIYWEEYLRKIFKFKVISETLAAQIMVLPLLWFKFGELNLFSLLNNILILPFVPYLMLLGFLALICFAFYPLNQILNLPFEFFSKLITLTAHMPKIYFPLSAFSVFLIYVLIFFLIFKINKNEKPDFNFNFNIK
jgi:ComEC/Rec2-related protein